MLVLVLALAVAQDPGRPAAPLRYRLDAKTASEQDRTSAGQGKLAGTLSTSAIISLTLTDSADGQIARITVDSISLTPTGEMTKQLPPAAVAAAADTVRGAYVRAYTVRGAVRGAAQASIPHPALAPILQAIGVLFPGLRSGLKVGEGWADTTAINNTTASGRQTGNVIALWKVTGTDSAGFILDGTASTFVTTTGQNGQVLHLIGSSKEHLVLAFRGGPSRSATIEINSDVTMTSPQTSTPIPMKSAGTLRLTPIP